MTRDRDILATRLGGLLARTRRRVLWRGLLTLLALGGAVVVAAVWVLALPGAPWPPVAWGLSLTALLLVVAVCRTALAAPLARLRDRRRFALLLERSGAHGNLVVAAEESLRRPERWPDDTPARAELRQRVRARAAAALEDVDLDTVAPLPNRGATGALALVVLAAFALGALAPVPFARGLHRLVTPWAAAPAAPTAGILTLPTPPFVIAGRDVDLQALDLARNDGTTVCEVRVGQGLWRELPASLVSDVRREPGRRWIARVAGAREDFHWRYRRGTIVSDERTVTVRDHPVLTGMAVTVTPPAYTRVPPRDLPRLPSWLEVPAGSRVTLRGTANQPVAAASLVLADGDSIGLVVEGRTLAGELVIDGPRRFHVGLTDTWGLGNVAPLGFEIEAAADQVPAVALERPDDDGLLPLEGGLVLLLEAADDYGVAGLGILARTENSAPWTTCALDLADGETWAEHGLGTGRLRIRAEALDRDQAPQRVRYRVEVQAGDLGLVPGDVLELLAEAKDNRRPGPPGTGRSRVLRFQLPSTGDVLARLDESDEARRSELEEMRRRGRELDTDLDRLTRELMKNPVPDWGRQQEIEEAIRRQQTLQKELARVADELQKELDELAASQLTSGQQLERADEVAALLDKQQSAGLSELLERLEQGGDRPQSQEVAQALRDVTRSQQDMARRLDAALAMLDRMAREQDLESMTAMLEQLMRKQQELAELSRQLAEQQAEADDGGEQLADAGENQDGEPSEGQGEETAGDGERESAEPGPEGADESADPAAEELSAEELARRQEALAEELEQLKERLEEAVAEMQQRQEEGGESPTDEQTRQAMEEALAQLEEQMQKNSMGEASEQLQQMDPETAAQMQQQAMRDLGSLYHVLLESQQAMAMAMQMKQVSSLRGLAGDLLDISARQEEIAETVPGGLRDVRSRELTRRQHRLQKATIGSREVLSGLLAEAPMRIMKLLEALDGIIEAMGQGVRAMEEGRAQVARRHTRQSLAATNKAVIGLLTEAQMQSSGQGGGSSSSDPSEQLRRMAMEQAKLNGATEELRRMLADRGMSQQMRSEMERLGQAQADLAARARELDRQERERPDGQRLLGDLGALGEDLEGIAEELDSGLVNEETLVRQDRILGRMLDARNAARRRDYSTRREARTAEELWGPPAAYAAPETEDEGRRGRLRYQPLEKAPLEYRDLVRRYFAGVDSLRRLDAPPAGGDLP